MNNIDYHQEEEDDDDHLTRFNEEWKPNFHWLTEHVAVGGWFPAERIAELARDHGVRAVVDLRMENCDDEVQLRAAGIDFLHLPTPDMEPASVDMLGDGVRFVRSQVAAGRGVLIHCQHGIGRSALLALCVLVDQGWEPLSALAHMKDRRSIVSPSLLQYEGWARWLKERGKEPPSYHEFGCIAYRSSAED